MSETRFKPGDKVRVKSNLVVGAKYHFPKDVDEGIPCVYFIEEMAHMRGEEVTILVAGPYGYSIKECSYNWTDEMFEEIEPEYVECVYNNGTLKGQLTVGNIYKVSNIINYNTSDEYVYIEGFNTGIYRGVNHSSVTNFSEYTGFKPSTKEAYELQNKSKAKQTEEKLMKQFKVGQWYKTKNSPYFGKFKSSSPKVEFYASEYFIDGYRKFDYDFCNGYDWVEATNEEIQFFLPDGHPDKELIFKEDEYYTSFNPDGTVWRVFICKNPEGYNNVVTKHYLNNSVHGYSRNHRATLALGAETYKVSTSEERQWLDACIKAGKYLTREEALKPVPEMWDVGTYVVVINPYFRSGTYIKGKIYQIFRKDMLAWIYTDENKAVNLVDSYITSGGIKWFATLEEAEAFDETIKTKITVESEMERLGLAVGDEIRVVDEPIKDAYYNGYSFEKLRGVRGQVYTINGGIILKNTLFVQINNFNNYVLATAVTKTPSKFMLGEYEVTIPDSSTIKIGCTKLNFDNVIGLLDDFIQISDKFGANEHDIIFINKVKVNRETADRLLSFISQC